MNNSSSKDVASRPDQAKSGPADGPKRRNRARGKEQLIASLKSLMVVDKTDHSPAATVAAPMHMASPYNAPVADMSPALPQDMDTSCLAPQCSPFAGPISYTSNYELPTVDLNLELGLYNFPEDFNSGSWIDSATLHQIMSIPTDLPQVTDSNNQQHVDHQRVFDVSEYRNGEPSKSSHTHERTSRQYPPQGHTCHGHGVESDNKSHSAEPQHRATKRSAEPSSHNDRMGASVSRRKPMRAHSAIEKRYRAGLQGNFKALGEVVSRWNNDEQNSDSGEQDEASPLVKMNKSRILEEAVVCINTLEEENDYLYSELEALIATMKASKLDMASSC